MREAGSLRVTEPFFDLFPRQPHLLKVLFHLIQAPLLALPGATIFWARLPSLLAATGTLAALFRLLARTHGETPFTLIACAALSLHPQFLLTAHVARQESLLLLCLVLALLLYERLVNTPFFPLVPLFIGVSALLHPNAFLLAAMLGARLLFSVLQRRARVSQLFWYGGMLVLAAALLAGGSLLLNPSFLDDYRSFGATLSVDAPPPARWQNFLSYFIKLHQRISGTYWLADNRFWFLLTGGTAAIALLLPARRLFRRAARTTTTGAISGTDAGGPAAGTPASAVSGTAARGPAAGTPASPAGRTTAGDLLCEICGYLAGMLIIGRFNPTAIVFLLPGSFRLIVHLLSMWRAAGRRCGRPANTVGGLLALTLAFSGVQAVAPFAGTGHTYETHLSEIRQALAPDAVVLGNLSAGFAFAGHPFYDIRNLAPVAGTTPDPAAYLAQRGINTVIWYGEYDYILRNPQWRILYETEPDSARDAGGLSGQACFLEALKAHLDTHGRLVHQFEAPIYGTRIIRYMGDGVWPVAIFRLGPPSSAETPPAPPRPPSQ
jgi:hypothetical protein